MKRKPQVKTARTPLVKPLGRFFKLFRGFRSDTASDTILSFPGKSGPIRAKVDQIFPVDEVYNLQMIGMQAEQQPVIRTIRWRITSARGEAKS